jgi:phage-related protein
MTNINRAKLQYNEGGGVDFTNGKFDFHLTSKGFTNLYEIDIRDKEGYLVAFYEQKNSQSYYVLRQGEEIDNTTKTKVNEALSELNFGYFKTI